VYVCNTITLESLDIGSSFSHIRYIKNFVNDASVYKEEVVKFWKSSTSGRYENWNV